MKRKRNGIDNRDMIRSYDIVTSCPTVRHTIPSLALKMIWTLISLRKSFPKDALIVNVSERIATSKSVLTELTIQKVIQRIMSILVVRDAISLGEIFHILHGKNLYL
jgi:hypothetical protein